MPSIGPSFTNSRNFSNSVLSANGMVSVDALLNYAAEVVHLDWTGGRYSIGKTLIRLPKFRHQAIAPLPKFFLRQPNHASRSAIVLLGSTKYQQTEPIASSVAQMRNELPQCSRGIAPKPTCAVAPVKTPAVLMNANVVPECGPPMMLLTPHQAPA